MTFREVVLKNNNKYIITYLDTRKIFPIVNSDFIKEKIKIFNLENEMDVKETFMIVGNNDYNYEKLKKTINNIELHLIKKRKIILKIELPEGEETIRCLCGIKLQKKYFMNHPQCTYYFMQ